ncbi:DeoR/GlpR family DNA-binding transcription regulator [Enterococcus caccae]|uniref:HTH deoR-type domain-containing protein n=1 Tax=Enterococcus caccae ATCC BAA-1240 TaxID=1158612 RepID=R3U9R2_9ENTE|nr:DeoR/GlpR family DNA-binding transcription regulator [Enterococcus caccae]EOL50734.1 hypothetical protein UC7_00185 [Enterococcus caccae ATCC BAA-1240]EOT59373.1 hypothetical protein I580_02405 [Enterococcus caccae ATCC BAA-1240]OJG27719.1 hypothetical protein RU98_GL002422 [Enterococcus caccae]
MKTSQGDVFRRRENLIEQLKQKEHLTVRELAKFFNVSAVTIRRDLLFLEKKKMIERFYGGVRLIEKQTLSQQPLLEKKVFPIAVFVEELSAFLPHKAQIFVGAGLFSTAIIQAFSFLEITILTNDVSALFIDHPEKKALITISGGELEKNTNALVGDFATYTFNKVEADLCIIEATGFNSHEVTTKTLSESFIYRTMIQHTKGLKIVYTPSSNLETVSSFMIDRTFLFDTLYTDSSISPRLLASYQAQGISVKVLFE